MFIYGFSFRLKCRTGSTNVVILGRIDQNTCLIIFAIVFGDASDAETSPGKCKNLNSCKPSKPERGVQKHTGLKLKI